MSKLTSYILSCVLSTKGILLKDLCKLVVRNKTEEKAWTADLDLSPASVHSRVQTLFAQQQIELVEWRIPGLPGVVGTLLLPKESVVLCSDTNVGDAGVIAELIASAQKMQSDNDGLVKAANDRDAEIDLQVGELEESVQLGQQALHAVQGELHEVLNRAPEGNLARYFEGYAVQLGGSVAVFATPLEAQGHVLHNADQKPRMFGMVPIDLTMVASVRPPVAA